MRLRDLLPKEPKYKPGELAMVVLIQHLVGEHKFTKEQVDILFTKAMSYDDEVIQNFIQAK